MGTWGTGLWQSDEALDVRDTFRHAIAEAQDVAGGTNLFVMENGARFEAPAEDPDFWLALAATQWAAGWLDPRVLANARALVVSEAELARWAPADLAKRAKVLAALADKLATPPPPPRRFPVRWPVQLGELQPGEVIGRRLPNGALAVMRVIGLLRTEKLKVRAPGVNLVKWTRAEMPGPGDLAGLERLENPLAPNGIQTIATLVLSAPRGADLPLAMFERPGLVAPLPPGEGARAWRSISAVAGATPDDVLWHAIRRWWENPELPAKAPPPWYKPRATAGA